MKDVNISCCRGDTAKWTLTAKDEDGVEVDLTGATVVMAVRRTPADQQLFELRSDTAGIVIRDQAQALGVADIKLRQSDTEQLANQDTDLFYSIHVELAGGDEVCVAKGTLHVSAVAWDLTP